MKDKKYKVLQTLLVCVATPVFIISTNNAIGYIKNNSAYLFGNSYLLLTLIIMPISGILYGGIIGLSSTEFSSPKFHVHSLINSIIFISVYYLIMAPINYSETIFSFLGILYQISITSYLLPILAGFFLYKSFF